MSGFVRVSEVSEIGFGRRSDYDGPVMKVRFLKSGTKPSEYPVPLRPEIAVVGRSNAGKSSFVNALTNRTIAKVSRTPGKTRLLNFFDLDEKVYMVDLPGYGFAKGNRREQAGWQGMIETYLEGRESLAGVLLIMDIRREWAEEEEMLKEWFAHHGIAWALILNKADKLSRSATLNRRRVLADALGIPVFVLSALKRSGLDEIKKLVFLEWGLK